MLELEQTLETAGLPSIHPNAVPGFPRPAHSPPRGPGASRASLTSAARAVAAAICRACEARGSSFSARPPSGIHRRSGPEARGVTGSATCRCWLSVSVGLGGPTGREGEGSGWRGGRTEWRWAPVSGARWAGGCGGPESRTPCSACPGCRGDFPAQPSPKVSCGLLVRDCECPLGTLVLTFRPEHASGGFEWGSGHRLWEPGLALSLLRASASSG